MNYLAKFKRGNVAKDLLYNVYVLYFFLVVSAIFLYILMQVHDFMSIAIFILIGFVTSFFSKNMVVIMAVSVIFTAMLKMGKSSVEGFQEGAAPDVAQDALATPSSTSGGSMSGTTAGTSGANDLSAPSAGGRDAASATASGASFPTATTMNKLATTAKTSAVANSKQKESINELLKDTSKLKELEKQANDLLGVQEQILQGLQKIEPMLDKAEALSNKMEGFSKR